MYKCKKLKIVYIFFLCRTYPWGGAYLVGEDVVARGRCQGSPRRRAALSCFSGESDGVDCNFCTRIYIEQLGKISSFRNNIFLINKL